MRGVLSVLALARGGSTGKTLSPDIDLLEAPAVNFISLSFPFAVEDITLGRFLKWNSDMWLQFIRHSADVVGAHLAMNMSQS